MKFMLICIPTIRVLNMCLIKCVESSKEKVVLIVEGLRHKCSLSPRHDKSGYGCYKSFIHG